MRVVPRSAYATALLVMVQAWSPAKAELKVGEVYDVKVGAFVIRDAVKTPVDKPDDVLLGDILGVDKRNARLQVALARSSQKSPITIRFGKLRLAGESELSQCELIDGVASFEGPPEPCPVSSKDLRIEANGTLFEVHVQARDSRVFVYEGSVQVFSTNPAYPEPRVVKAGEWVRARRGEPIPEVRRFIPVETVAGPGSGSAECIYSDCTFVYKVPIPPPPVFTPSVRVPPPPNPPARR